MPVGAVLRPQSLSSERSAKRCQRQILYCYKEWLRHSSGKGASGPLALVRRNRAPTHTTHPYTLKTPIDRVHGTSTEAPARPMTGRGGPLQVPPPPAAGLTATTVIQMLQHCAARHHSPPGQCIRSSQQPLFPRAVHRCASPRRLPTRATRLLGAYPCHSWTAPGLRSARRGQP